MYPPASPCRAAAGSSSSRSPSGPPLRSSSPSSVRVSWFLPWFPCPALRRLAHNEQVVKTAEEEVPLLGGLAVVAHLQRLVVPHDGDNVHRVEPGFTHAVEQLEAQRVKALSLDKRVADVQGHVRPGLQDADDLGENPLHRRVVLAAGGVELANVARVGAVVEVR